jgi:hypothetical protein
MWMWWLSFSRLLGTAAGVVGSLQQCPGKARFGGLCCPDSIVLLDGLAGWCSCCLLCCAWQGQHTYTMLLSVVDASPAMSAAMHDLQMVLLHVMLLFLKIGESSSTLGQEVTCGLARVTLVPVSSNLHDCPNVTFGGLCAKVCSLQLLLSRGDHVYT